jgi:YD repeat-containing protein
LHERVFSASDTLMADRVYVYEPSGRLREEHSSVTEYYAPTTSTSSHLTYDAAGRLLTRTTTKQVLMTPRPPPSTTRVSRTYDADGRLLQVEQLEQSGESRQHWFHTYSHDAQLRLVTVETHREGELRLRRVVTYDAEGRRLRVDPSGPDNWGYPDQYFYPDEGGWRVEHRAPGWVETWTYDAQGRLLGRRSGDPSGTSGESFSFDAAGRRLTSGEGYTTSRSASTQAHTHTYDEEGRRVRTETERHWHDSHTHPIDRHDERTLTTYTYDAAGQFRLREERVLYARSAYESRSWESAPPGFLLERTEAHGCICRPPPDAPPPHDSADLPP